MLVEKKSILTGKLQSMEIDMTKEEYQEILEGESIDIVLPDLSRCERKFLLTGILPEDED